MTKHFCEVCNKEIDKDKILEITAIRFCDPCPQLCLEGIEKCKRNNCEYKQTYLELKKRLEKAEKEEV